MATRKPSPTPRALFPPRPHWDPGILREAWDLFAFSVLVAILFNLLFPYGIDLRAHTPEARNPIPSGSPAPHYPGFNPPSEGTSHTPTAPDPFARISLMGAKERFDQGRSVFLDARPAEEYDEGHIPGALSFYAEEFDEFAPRVLPRLLDKDQELVAYCHGSSCELSVLLAQRLSDLGYTHVKVFFGGWPEWKKAGYPVKKGGAP